MYLDSHLQTLHRITLNAKRAVRTASSAPLSHQELTRTDRPGQKQCFGTATMLTYRPYCQVQMQPGGISVLLSAHPKTGGVTQGMETRNKIPSSLTGAVAH